MSFTINQPITSIPHSKCPTVALQDKRGWRIIYVGKVTCAVFSTKSPPSPSEWKAPFSSHFPDICFSGWFFFTFMGKKLGALGKDTFYFSSQKRAHDLGLSGWNWDRLLSNPHDDSMTSRNPIFVPVLGMIGYSLMYYIEALIWWSHICVADSSRIRLYVREKSCSRSSKGF